MPAGIATDGTLSPSLHAEHGAQDALELDVFPDEHAWGGNKSEAFFRKHLGGEWR